MSHEKARRPLLVWLVSLAFGSVGLATVVNTALVASGAVSIPETYRSQLLQLGTLQVAARSLAGLLMFLFSVALFRLRASAVRWCEVLIGLSLAITIHQVLRFGLPTSPAAMVAVAFSFLILAATYLYTRHIQAVGTLA